MSRALIFVLLVGLPAAAQGGSAVQVECVSGETFAATLDGFGPEGFVLGTSSGPRRLAAQDLLLLHAPAPAPRRPAPRAPPTVEPPLSEPPPAADLLFLAGPGGDRLVGRLTGGGADGVIFDLGDGEPLAVAFDDLERLLPAARLPVDRLALLAGAADDDRLWRRREDGGLDSLTGVVDGLSGTHVVFEGALGRLEFPLAEVVAVVLAGAGAPPPSGGLPGLPVVVRLRGGSRLHAGLLEADARNAVLATAFAPRLELPSAALVALLPAGPDRLLLADLQPVEVEERPTAGGPQDVLFPWRRDLSVTGQLLCVGGVPRASGLGVHATSRLAFELPPDVRSLRVTGGLCDEVLDLPAQASVAFRILLDGQLRAEARVVEEGSPARLRVDALQGGRRLELLLTDGGDDDAGDRAAWVDGVLLRAAE